MDQSTVHKTRLIEWTGERCVPWADAPEVIYEHLHRYLFAAEFAHDKAVIDLGSGEGYGTGLLATLAKSVVGVELDPDSVEHARINYPFENVSFHCESVLQLDNLPEASYDVVVCFEMIEHIEEHETLLSTVVRLLKPDGIFVVSTPDREEYTEAHDYHNPFHVKELSRQEFEELLARHFTHTALWTQSGFVRSIFERVGEGQESSGIQELAVRRAGDSWYPTMPVVPPYMVAIASRSPLPSLPTSSVLSRNQPPEDEYGEAGLIRRLATLETQLAESENSCDVLHAKIAHYSALHESEMNRMRLDLAALEGQVTAMTTEREHLQQLVAAGQARVEDLLSSTSWRMTRPLRLLSRLTEVARGRAAGSSL